MTKVIVNGQTIQLEDVERYVSHSKRLYKCQFVFGEDWGRFPIKTAVFENDMASKEAAIGDDNQCEVPHEVLDYAKPMRIGVYGADGEVVCPTVWTGLVKVYQGTSTDGVQTDPTPTQYEQIIALIAEGKVRGERGIGIKSIAKTGTQDLADFYTITFDDDATFVYIVMNGAKGDKGDAGQIEMLIVDELPDEGEVGIIYLVPIDEPETENNFEEWIWVVEEEVGSWEKLGGIQAEIDLSQYAKFTDYATADRGGTIKLSTDYGLDISADGKLRGRVVTAETYPSRGNAYFISKGTLENIIPSKVAENIPSDYVKFTDYANENRGGTIRPNWSYGSQTNSAGYFVGRTVSFADYEAFQALGFLSKGTIENLRNANYLASGDYVDQKTASVEAEAVEVVESLSSASTHNQIPSAKAVWDNMQKKATSTSATLLSTGWVNNEQTVSVSEVSTSNIVFVSPSPSDVENYVASGIYCSAQAEGSLTFKCSSVPTSAIGVEVVII